VNTRTNHGRTGLLAVAWAVVLCHAAVAYTPQMIRWHIEATVTKIVDPLGLFPNVRLGDPVHGMLKYDLELFANPFFSGTYDRDFMNDTWVDVTKVTIENSRDQSEMHFQTNVDGDFADVDVFNDYPDEEFGDFDLVYAAQSVVAPAGYQGSDAVWAVWIEGPTTILPPFVEPWIDNHPPAELNLDDWPIASLEFWDGYFEDPTATNIEAEIYSLTPITAPHIPGDYDYDGDVDADDYYGWKDHYGGGELLYADGNGDGSVDAADYVVWRDRFGQTTGSTSGANAKTTVPEPAAWVQLIVAALSIRLRGRQFVSRVPRTRKRVECSNSPPIFGTSVTREAF
jgi:hypothetical protein